MSNININDLIILRFNWGGDIEWVIGRNYEEITRWYAEDYMGIDYRDFIIDKEEGDVAVNVEENWEYIEIEDGLTLFEVAESLYLNGYTEPQIILECI